MSILDPGRGTRRGLCCCLWWLRLVGGADDLVEPRERAGDLRGAGWAGGAVGSAVGQDVRQPVKLSKSLDGHEPLAAAALTSESDSAAPADTPTGEGSAVRPRGSGDAVPLRRGLR